MVDKKTANKLKGKVYLIRMMKLIFYCSCGQRRKAYLVWMLGISNSESGQISSCLVTIINPFPYRVRIERKIRTHFFDLVV